MSWRVLVTPQPISPAAKKTINDTQNWKESII
ncbi:unannotated protein [freshwater metagenome]|uniref:Unannotated protein n=1 Tax=freshwater metagenome TaxID=449393 RepID=A0A6J7W515_9ZZZZ